MFASFTVRRSVFATAIASVFLAIPALAFEMTVKGGRVSFRGLAERYTGEYELQVYVGPIWGPGYGSEPSMIYVP